MSFTGAAFKDIFEFLLFTCSKVFLLYVPVICFCNISSGLIVDLLLTIYCCLLKNLYCLYREYNLSVPPLRFFRIRAVKFLDSCFWKMSEQSRFVS